VSALSTLVRGWRLDLSDPDTPNGFDALRFFAASLVLVGHSWPLTGHKPEPWVGSWDSLGGMGVGIFFVISGFLVASSRERSATIGSFLHKRALRILPGFLFVCLVSVFALGPALTTLPLGDYFDHPQARGYFGNLTMFDVQLALPAVFADNVYPHAVNGSTWTLPIEVFMYVLLAFGSWLFLERWRMLAIAAIAMIAWQMKALEWAGSGAHLWTTLPLYYTVRYGIFFALGTTAYLWRDKLPLSPIGAALLWAAALLLSNTPFGTLAYMLALAYSTLLVAALPWRVLTGLGRWGDFSYGMYMFAFPVQQSIVHFGGAALWLPLDIAICFAVTLCCAAISWHLVEYPALQLKSGAHVR
jgi:peptidoglycan/LPS O-acetylase OafA/YrhL